MKWFEKFMRGRYGVDQLNFFMLIVSMVILVLSTLFRIPFVYWLSIILLILCYVRMFSRNISKRYAENAKFLQLISPISRQFNQLKRRWKDRKSYKYYKCPNCKQQLRVPKGRGEITITCPKCHTKFDKRT